MRVTAPAFGAAIAVILAPGLARAEVDCSPPINDCISGSKIVVASIPADGVIPIELVPQEPYAFTFGATAAAMTRVEVSADGVAVAGALESVDALRVLVWRPDAPLTAGSTYTVEVTVDNSMMACDFLDPIVVNSFEVTATADPLPVSAPAIAADATPLVSPNPETDLDSLVCCDGAYPATYPTQCGTSVSWSEGQCATNSGTGYLDVSLTLDAAAAQVTMGQIGQVFAGVSFPPGATAGTTTALAPACARPTVVHLATGTTSEGAEVCFGQGLEDMLGEQAVDPTPWLSACVGEPYVCELDASGQAWDREACGETQLDGTPKGCGCASGPGGPWSLALLLAWRRRRVTRR